MISTPHKDGRIIAVSNRTAAGSETKAGGLAVALWDALTQSQGSWVGWTGRIYDFERSQPKQSEEEGVTFHLLDYSKKDFEGFYLGYANSVLWPVMHGRVDLANFESSFFAAYARINEKYAKALINIAEPNDLIWVHDYHFFLLADALRKKGWVGKCGFFLHIPFPDVDTFRAVPEHDVLARGLAAFDVIGLQTQRDVENLSTYFVDLLGAERLDAARIKYEGRIIVLWHCPIGIDVEAFRTASISKPAKKAAKRISQFTKNRDLILGVDRMDYSKGLPQRFAGVARFFDAYPELHGKTSFTQIAPPSRAVVEEYKDLRKELDALCGRINGDYGDLDWIPIRYLAKGYAREELAGVYRHASVCLVTPLQDGMNLVAKEFVAAQSPKDPGVLILSQFAGAADQLSEALIVNPHNPLDIAEAIHTALNMPVAERQRRHAVLLDNIQTEDIGWWRTRFFQGFELIDA